jgi:hypothetical protein
MYYDTRAFSPSDPCRYISIGKSISLGRAIKSVETFFQIKPDFEVVVYQVSEDDLEDVDCNNWKTNEMREREKLVKHWIWREGKVQDA